VADVLLTGQRVLPRRTQETGFAFRFPDVQEALNDVARS
jgi:NAD dependent epimerase/dehydratase family enzyme